MKSIESKNFFFFSAFALLNINYVTYGLLRWYNPLFYLLLIPFLLLSFDYKHCKKYYSLLLPFGVICLLIPSSFFTFLIMYIMMGSNRYSLRSFCYFNLVSQLLILTIVFFLIQFEILSVESISYQVGDILRVRSDGGFGNPNIFSLFMFYFIGMIYLLIRQSYLRLISITVLGVIVYLYTDSNTFLASIFSLLIFHIGLQTKGGRYILRKPMLYTIPGILIAITLYFSYKVQQYPLLDLIFSGRFSYGNILLSKINIKDWIIGTPLVSTITIDNAYFHLIFTSGLYWIILFYTLYIKAVKRASPEFIDAFPFLVASLFYGLGETSFAGISLSSGFIVWILLFRNSFGIVSTSNQ